MQDRSRLHSQPPLDEFADALERIFSGNNFFPDRPAAQTETDWTLAELKCACARLKVNKACDESGLAAELLQYVPDEFLVELLRLFNGILQHGSAPTEWKKTSFTMLPKKTRAKLVTDFRPIANIPLFYKVFGYMILARVEQSSEHEWSSHRKVFNQKHNTVFVQAEQWKNTF